MSKSNYLLQDIRGVESGIRAGRNIFEGYQRAWGLQQRDTAQHVRDDPIYRRACAVSDNLTLLGEMQKMNLFLLLRFFFPQLPTGAHIIEFGSFRGGSALFMASVIKEILPATKVYALDTFSGISEADPSIDAHSLGDFSNNSALTLIEAKNSLGFDNLEVVVGSFHNTFGKIATDAGSFGLAHIDCAVLNATAFAYESANRYMCDGGYIVFDDANVSTCIGATEVVEDLVIRRDKLNSEQIWPHFVFRKFNAG